ncbi:hypothetical protein ZIOFF_029866 [Zingiber officinale]|uniref:Uncharacterized protein n=1 Tax=Zingiber officinale TaxID=94328 RepID=A0A8J5H268_ZINOF|nr:hypothetical protein ZIOFF_029866 [Zingiber officinale]
MDLLDAVVPRLISVPRAVLAGGFSWAWAVSVTAAVFVLWIRAFGSGLLAFTLSPPPPSPPMTTTVQSSSEDESKAASPLLRSDAASVANPLNRYLGEVSTTKRRFKTCYDGSSIGVTGTEEDDSEVDERWRTAPRVGRRLAVGRAARGGAPAVGLGVVSLPRHGGARRKRRQVVGRRKRQPDGEATDGAKVIILSELKNTDAAALVAFQGNCRIYKLQLFGNCKKCIIMTIKLLPLFLHYSSLNRVN